jgi:hypothetical protein
VHRNGERKVNAGLRPFAPMAEAAICHAARDADCRPQDISFPRDAALLFLPQL